MSIGPNVRWGDERTYEFAFEGLAPGGVFAVGTNGCVRDKDDRYYFMHGLHAMIETLHPSAIVNYYYYSKDIFAECEERGIPVVTLDYWTKSRKGQGG